MKKFLLGASAISAVLIGTSALASIVVVGSSPGRSCYEAAVAENGSLSALQGCDLAFASGMLSRRDIIATHVNRGIVRAYGNNVAGAIADYDRALAMDPTEPEAYLNKGAAYLRIGRNADAIPLFNAALERQTKRPELAYFGRAVAHEMTGNVSGAYYDYQRAQAAAPKWEDPARELTRFKVRGESGSL